MALELWQQKLISIFKSKAALTSEAETALLLFWKHAQTFKRNEYLIERGQLETKLFFILKGSLRIYFPHGDEEICVGFAYDNNLICSYPSFIQQKPSDYYMQVLIATDVMAIKRQDFYTLLDEHPSLERAWRMLEEDALLGKIERETEMLTFTSEERYNRLLERSPHIFQIIPRKYIASYLRMTPETLSRMKPG